VIECLGGRNRAGFCGLLLFAALSLNEATAFDWQPGSGFKSAKLSIPKVGKTGFTLLSPARTGITFTNFLGKEMSLTNTIVGNGSGVAAGDVDGDGWCDLYFCSLQGGNALYRNLGDWRFEDITAVAGVACAGQLSTGAVFADVDGDGDLDLLVNSIGGGTRLFLNDGKGHFTEKLDAGLLRKFGAMSLALADIDGDGYLDLYVANYRTTTIQDDPATRFSVQNLGGKAIVTKVNGQPAIAADFTNRFTIGPDMITREAGEPDALYHNERNGRFSQVPFTGGSFLDEDGKPLSAPPYDWGLSVMFRDMNGDGAPDIYVCNDSDSPDRIWLNDGAGHFRAIQRPAIRHSSLSSMGVDFADINRDGNDDFIVLDMLSRDHRRRQRQERNGIKVNLPIGQINKRPQYSQNTFFIGRGDGTFAEIAYFSGLHATDWSWCPIFLDVDLDGYEDLLISNGFYRDVRDLDALDRINSLRQRRDLTPREELELRKLFPSFETSKLAFRNMGDLRFQEVGREWGFDLVGVSHGMALADLDNDGDLDVVINTLNGPAAILRNESIAPRIAVRLSGAAGNNQGIGARIKVFGGAVPMQSQEVICGGRYLSGDDPMRVFAAGGLTNHLTIEVVWRSGQHSVVQDAKPNHIYAISETPSSSPSGADENGGKSVNSSNSPFFQDVSHLVKHTHHENVFDDFERQPLLPKRLSQLGPGVAWCDLNGDGSEDLVIGSGQGGSMRVMFGNGQGGFSLIKAPAFGESAASDQSGIASWSAEAGSATLLVGQSNYEQSTGATPACARFDFLSGEIKNSENLGSMEASAGPLAIADLDGDGDLDLFVGGRVLGGKYPEPASSRIYRNERGHFALDKQNSRMLEKVGLVSGAVWTDLDGDGFPELVLACEWGPLKIFRNNHGKLTAWDAPILIRASKHSSLNQLTGWWNGITAGDLDGDGRLDLIASNWGRNTKYEEFLADELRLYYGDLDENGTIDLVEAYWDRTMKKVVPWRNRKTISVGLPFVMERFQSYREFASASVEEIFGAKLRTARELRANTLDSTLFLNRGDHFEVIPLPLEAQLSPAFGVSVADLDGDGHEDVFLSQNFFSVDIDTSRYDAGRGLWLKGDGKGRLRAVPGQESGILAYGEQRGSAVADYDGDGRVDLVVTQNGAPTKLFHNVGARPGLRVRLNGPTGNRTGIGAVVRLVDKEGGLGPAREIHGGSGYWSQDSPVQVMSVAGNAEPAGLSVRWPGGKTTQAYVPQGSREIEAGVDGTIRRVR